MFCLHLRLGQIVDLARIDDALTENPKTRGSSTQGQRNGWIREREIGFLSV